jgi:hypothetical protein
MIDKKKATRTKTDVTSFGTEPLAGRRSALRRNGLLDMNENLLKTTSRSEKVALMLFVEYIVDGEKERNTRMSRD